MCITGRPLNEVLYLLRPLLPKRQRDAAFMTVCYGFDAGSETAASIAI